MPSRRSRGTGTIGRSYAPRIETDYLIVGAGAAGMAFADALVARTGADVVLVDRRHAPGGHWLDAYPFVRLHQPSACYGVDSTPLGGDRIGADGFYERATAPEICGYFARVLDDVLLPTGRVRFLGGHEWRGDHAVSLLTGARVDVRVRRKLVDATYVETSIPKRHAPGFAVDGDATFVPPNDLVDLAEPPGGFTVLGAGKTAMDTCGWLLENGVDPDRIRWFRPRDPWLFDRAWTQPLELVPSYLHLQASWVEAGAKAADAADFARRLEDDGVFVRIDPGVEPTAFRSPTISQAELGALRTVERVVRSERVRRVAGDRIETDAGSHALAPGEVVVDCTAAGLRPVEARPVFEPGRVTLQYVTVGFLSLSAATIGVVEAGGPDDDEGNRLCPPVVWTGLASELPSMALAGMQGMAARTTDRAVQAWNDATRLNPAAAAGRKLDDPAVRAPLERLGRNVGTAFANLGRLVGG